MKLSITEVRELVRTLSEGVTLHFPPGAVKDYVSLAAEMADVQSSAFKYDGKNGSQISFTTRQFVDFLDFLKTALDDKELVTAQEKADIQSVLDHVMKQLGQA